MIVSASLNADVPARHGEWFLRRLDAGFCRVAGADPFQARRIALTPDCVDAFVFWTRNVAPFVPILHEIRRREYAFVVHHVATQSGPAEMSVRHLADVFGPESVVWRFDAVTAADEADPEALLERFGRIARRLLGATDEVVLAFQQAPCGLEDAQFDLAPRRPDSIVAAQSRRGLVSQFVAVARGCAMGLTVCAQPEYLVPGSRPARCIDLHRLSRVCGRVLDAETAGLMPDCLCARAVDLGDRAGAPRHFCGVLPHPADLHSLDPASEFLSGAKPRFPVARGDDVAF